MIRALSSARRALLAVRAAGARASAPGRPPGRPFRRPRQTSCLRLRQPAVARRPRHRRPQIIAGIEQRTGAEVVVYTQYKPGSDEDSTDARRQRPDQPVGRGPRGLRRRPRDPDQHEPPAVPARRQRQRPGPALRRRRLPGGVPVQPGAAGDLRQRHEAAAARVRLRRRDHGRAREDRRQRHARARQHAATRRAASTRPSASIGAPLLLILLVGWAAAGRGCATARDPVYLDDPRS